MTPYIINLITPKADQKPRARRSASSPPAAAAVYSLLDLTAKTPSPVLAQGIADDDDDCRCSDARHDADRVPTVHLTSGTFPGRASTRDETHPAHSHQSPIRRCKRRNCGHCNVNRAARRIGITMYSPAAAMNPP